MKQSDERLEPRGVVLVVDDADSVVQMTPGLAEAGYEVISFRESEQIASCLSRRACDVVIADLEFCQGQGFNIFDSVAHDENSIATIVVSSKPTLGKVLNSWNRDASFFLKKPLDFERMLNAVKKAVENKRFYERMVSRLDELQKSNDELLQESKELKRSRKQFRTIEKIAKSIASSLELDKVLSGILESIAHASRFDRILLSMIDWNQEVEEAAMAMGVSKDQYETTLSEMTWPLAGEDRAPWADQVVHSGKSYISDGTFGDGAVSEKAARLFPGPMAKIPLVVKDVVVGTITVDNIISKRPISQEHTEVIERFSEYAAIAIMNAKLYMRAVEAQDELKKAQGKLLEAERLVTIERLVATVSHEINNPLCSILLSAQMLETMVADEGAPISKKAKAILADVEQISAIVGKLQSIQKASPMLTTETCDMFDLDGIEDN
ncbi:response regulator [bacterium]|nr:response regulator [bacterium]